MGFARAAVSSDTDEGIPYMPRTFLYRHRLSPYPVTHL